MDYCANAYLPIIDPLTISQSQDGEVGTGAGSDVGFQNVDDLNLI